MPGSHGGNLSVLGLCAYCETPTQDTCRLCGRAICPDHSADAQLVCVDCARGRADE